MTSRLDTRRPRSAAPPAATGPGPAIRLGPVTGSGPAAHLGPAADPAHPRCERGGLDAVINGSDLATAATHLSVCMSCQTQFLAQGGLLPVPQRATGLHADGAAGHAVPAHP
jgi:hypothetical protein